MTQELRKEWEMEFDEIPYGYGDAALSRDVVKSFISSLLAKQQEEFVKCIPEEVPETHSEDCPYQRKGCDCGYMERLSYNVAIKVVRSNIKSKLK